MTFDEARKVLGSILFAYYGPGYTWRHAIDDIMAAHPRGRGISGNNPNAITRYQAALVIKREMSRTKSYVRGAK